MLINQDKKAKKKLLKVLNASWKVAEIPSERKKGITVPILKQDKDRFNPNNRRPISLFRCFGKVMYRLLNRTHVAPGAKNN